MYLMSVSISILIVKYSSSCWRRKWQPTLVSLPGKCHGQKSLVGCSPWGRKELDMTGQLTLYIFL